MASSAMKMKSNGFCLVDLELKGNKYKSTRLNVFENLCSDVILGLDFQGRHQHINTVPKNKVQPLAECKSFPVTDSALKSIELLKTELAKAAL